MQEPRNKDEEIQIPQPKLSKKLSAALNQVQELAKQIASVAIDNGLDLKKGEYVENLKTYMIGVVTNWCGGASFGEICKLANLSEGTLNGYNLYIKLSIIIFLIQEASCDSCVA